MVSLGDTDVLICLCVAVTVTYQIYPDTRQGRPKVTCVSFIVNVEPIRYQEHELVFAIWEPSKSNPVCNSK